MQGIIKLTVIKQFYELSFGIITDEAGNERFFHVTMFEGDLRSMRPGTKVEFSPTVGGRDNAGLRAANVRVVA